MEKYLSIQAISNLTGITAHTLRYYEKNGLIHAIARGSNGRRQYSVNDLTWIRFLVRLRTTGMSIRQMQQIADLRRQGSATTKERRVLLEAHKNKLAAQIERLQEHYEVINEKIEISPNQLKWHMNFGLKVGITPNEIIEIATHCIPFCGFPRALNAVGVAKQLFAEQNIEVNIEDELLQNVGERRERGLAKLQEIDGKHGDAVVDSLADIAPQLAEQIIDFAFGEIYSRSGLNPKQRQLVTLGAYLNCSRWMRAAVARSSQCRNSCRSNERRNY